MDCGEKDLRVLESDHVRGEKLRTINTLTKGSWPLVELWAELDKCETRCANCHQRATYIRQKERGLIPGYRQKTIDVAA